jgi:hypothetical protein
MATNIFVAVAAPESTVEMKKVRDKGSFSLEFLYKYAGCQVNFSFSFSKCRFNVKTITMSSEQT